MLWIAAVSDRVGDRVSEFGRPVVAADIVARPVAIFNDRFDKVRVLRRFRIRLLARICLAVFGRSRATICGAQRNTTGYVESYALMQKSPAGFVGRKAGAVGYLDAPARKRADARMFLSLTRTRTPGSVENRTQSLTLKALCALGGRRLNRECIG